MRYFTPCCSSVRLLESRQALGCFTNSLVEQGEVHPQVSPSTLVVDLECPTSSIDEGSGTFDAQAGRALLMTLRSSVY